MKHAPKNHKNIQKLIALLRRGDTKQPNSLRNWAIELSFNRKKRS